MDISSYIARLIRKYNQPSHTQLETALKEIDGNTEYRSAWSAVLRSSLLPRDFEKGGPRTFAVATGRLLWPTDRPPEQSVPPSTTAVLTVAANADEMLDAERLAMEFANRLAPWGAVCNNEIVWYFTENEFEQTYIGRPFNSAIDSVDLTLDQHGIDPLQMTPNESVVALPLLVRRTLGALTGWNRCVQQKFPLSEPSWVGLSSWKTFEDIENPFQSLLDFWCTGFRIASSFETTDPTIRLYAKPATSQPDLQKLSY